MNATSRGALPAALLLALAAVQLGIGFGPGKSVDFYQFWGVGAARAEVPGLPTPWSDPAAYRAALERRFADESRPEILRVHRFRMQELEPFGSPLLYLAFAPLPGDYATALALFRALQTLAFAAGVFALARLGGWPALAALLLPGALVLLYRPLGDDLLTGNLNGVQLGGLALALHWTERGLASGAPEHRARWGAAVLLLLAALALLKANVAIAAAALAFVIGRRLGARELSRASALAAPGLVALVAGPCLYFRSASAWLDWVRRVFTADPARLSEYALAAGNTSTPRLLEEAFGIPVFASSALVGAVLLASLAAVPRRAWREPQLGVGLGIVAVLAVAPLVWFHYFVLALVPGLWLVTSERGVAPRALAAGALVVYSACYLGWVPRAALPTLYALWSLTWIPLWCALLIRSRLR